MSLAFWGGIAANLVVSLGVGLATPRIQSLIGERYKSLRRKRREKEEEEYRAVLYYAAHPDMLLGRLIIDSMQLTFACAFLLAVLIEFNSYLASSKPPIGGLQMILATHWLAWVWFCVGFALGAAIIRSVAAGALEGVRIYKRVGHLPVYLASVPAEMRDHDAERLSGLGDFVPKNHV